MQNYLHIKNLDAGYEKGFQLNKIDFTVSQGSIAGIIGPNGSGKTTLFKCLCGDMKPVSGKIYLNEQDISVLPIRKKAQKVAVVAQFTDNTEVSVEDYVLMGRMPYRSNFQFFESKADYQIAEKYMKLTGVNAFRNKPMTELSGGEQQLAAIARALTQEPELLLLDEPTSHLDISHQVQILNLIQQLNTELKLTVLIIIHDLNLASEYCDYLIMMKGGRIHIKGTPQQVLNYQTIEEVYNTVVITRENPVSKKPVVFLVSDRVLKAQP